jgi:hypothetical protein
MAEKTFTADMYGLSASGRALRDCYPDPGEGNLYVVLLARSDDVILQRGQVSVTYTENPSQLETWREAQETGRPLAVLGQGTSETNIEENGQ